MLALTFLKSYSDVGKVNVTCASGCSCKPKVFDAKNTRPTSELHTERMEVSRRHAQGCLDMQCTGLLMQARTRPAACRHAEPVLVESE